MNAKSTTSIKGNLAVRSAAIAASFLLALIIATFATGCASGGSSGAQSAVPGSYAIDPAAVDTSTVTEPVSCMGRHLREPKQRVSYPDNVPRLPESGHRAGELRRVSHLRCGLDPPRQDLRHNEELAGRAGEGNRRIPGRLLHERVLGPRCDRRDRPALRAQQCRQ